MKGCGTVNVCAEAGVEPLGQVAAQFHVLALVLAHGDTVRLVEEDVRGLQDRVGEQADAGLVRALFVGLVLELGHPGRLAESRDAVQDPGQLGVLRHLGLDEQRALFDVDAAGNVLRGRDPGAVGQFGGILRNGDRVQVRDEEDGVVLVLHPDPVHEGAEVVAQVQGVGRGLHAGEDAVPGSGGRRSGLRGFGGGAGVGHS